MPRTFTVRTAKGRHFYFRQPGGLGNSEGALHAYNLNVRGVGGYVVAPGSLHASGVVYEVINDAEIAECPAWLVDALRSRDSRPAATVSADGSITLETSYTRSEWWRDGDIAAGKRHGAFVAAAGWCRQMGLERGEAVPVMRDVFARCTDDGTYTLTDALGQLDDIYRRYEGGDVLGARKSHDPLNVDNTEDDTHVSIELIDWSTIHDRPDEIVSGFIIPGRWTALAAPAKAGKSLLLLYVTVAVSQGCDPFDGTTIAPVTTLYVDAEMGRHDLAERLTDLGVDPVTLDRWHATDMPPRLGTPEGGAALVVAAQQLGAGVVVIDGINGTVDGAENDDTTWRPFYDYTVSPLKRLGVAVITGDNLGKDKTLGPRGSSVKIDKPDAVLSLSRTDDGVRLAATHRRTSAYPDQRHLRIEGVHDTRVVRYRDVEGSWPSGTEAAAKLLDALGVPVEHGRTKARRALTDAGEAMSNTTLTAAIRWRQRHADRGQK